MYKDQQSSGQRLNYHSPSQAGHHDMFDMPAMPAMAICNRQHVHQTLTPHWREKIYSSIRDRISLTSQCKQNLILHNNNIYGLVLIMRWASSLFRYKYMYFSLSTCVICNMAAEGDSTFISTCMNTAISDTSPEFKTSIRFTVYTPFKSYDRWQFFFLAILTAFWQAFQILTHEFQT